MTKHPLLACLPLVLAITACDDDLTIGAQEDPNACGEVGRTRPADDGCNECTCAEDGTWVCTDDDCAEPPCERGDEKVADDGCNTCLCLGDGTWSCGTGDCPTPECERGDEKLADDGCNACVCGDDGTWSCDTGDCPTPECERGDEKLADDGCNACVCGDDGTWSCDTGDCPTPECAEGAVQPADDDCNTCTCVGGGWSCTENPCPLAECTAGEVRDAGDGCNTCECVVVLDGGGSNRWSCTEDTCAPPECTGFTDQLVNVDGWVGGDPATTADNPLGIQGAWFTAGDGIACDVPVGNPCDASGCTVSGSTRIDPTYTAWGCMVGLELNSTGGDMPVMHTFAGPANCFDLMLSGRTGAAPVRLGFFDEETMTGRVGPFQEIGPVNGPWAGRLCLSDVTCPEVMVAAGLCDPGMGVDTPYVLYAQIVGAEANEPAVSLTIESVTPGTCDGSTAQTCAEGESVTVDGCTECTCLDGAWSCTESDACAPPPCEVGALTEAGDGCNLCECVMVLDVGPEWQCGTDDCVAGTCVYAPDELVNVDGWVGGDPAMTEDDPSGIQGAWYAFGDGIACTPPDGNPCTADGCELHGDTVVDATYVAWGCGLGLQLQDSGSGLPTESPYAGPADCFWLRLSGTTSGAAVHVALTDHPNAIPDLAKFVDLGPLEGGYEGEVCRWDVACPSWAVDSGLCDETVGVALPYDLQILVAGGDTAGPVDLIVESLTVATCE